MALVKDIEAPSGVNANYHRIANAFVNARVDPAQAEVVVMSYATKAAFEAGKGTLDEKGYRFPFDPSAAENAHQQCYAQLKTLEPFIGATDDL